MAKKKKTKEIPALLLEVNSIHRILLVFDGEEKLSGSYVDIMMITPELGEIIFVSSPDSTVEGLQLAKMLHTKQLAVRAVAPIHLADSLGEYEILFGPLFIAKEPLGWCERLYNFIFNIKP